MKNAVVGAGSKVPHLSYVGDADDRRGHQHRRGHGLRELRRRRQAPHRRRRPRAHRQRHHARRAGDDRRRRLHRRRLGDHRGRARRARWPWPGRGSATSRAGWSASGPAVPQPQPLLPQAPPPLPLATPGTMSRAQTSEHWPRTAAPTTGQAPGDRHQVKPREDADALRGPGAPRARGGDRRGARRRPHSHRGLRLRQRRDLRPVRGVGARLRRLRPAEPHRRPSTSGSWSS